jgi:hypothetical protein
MFDREFSVEIFKTLTNGKLINRYVLQNNGSETENPLYSELLSNIETYRQQYQMCGYELVEREDFVFLRDGDVSYDELPADNAMRISILLLIIGKFINDRGYVLGKLVDANGGLSEDDLAAIDELETTAELLEKGNFKSNFATAFTNYLVNRNIVLRKPSDGRYLLSAGGRAFFEELRAK